MRTQSGRWPATGPESGTSAKGWQGNQIRFYNNTLSNWKNEDTTPFNSSYTIGLSGNINSPGSMVSPLLSGGCSAIKVLYGYHMLSNSNKGGLSINIKITDAAGKELFKKDAIVEYNPVEQFKPKQNVIQIANFAGGRFHPKDGVMPKNFLFDRASRSKYNIRLNFC